MSTATTLTTTWFRDNYALLDWAGSPQIEAAFFTRAPAFNALTAGVFDTLTTLESLQSRVEWVPVRANVTARIAGDPEPLYAAPFDSGPVHGLRIVNGSGDGAFIDHPTDPSGWVFWPNPPATSVQEVLSAVVFYLVDADGSTYGGGINPIMFATTVGIGDGTVLHDGAVYGQFFLPNSVVGGRSHLLSVDSSTVPPTYEAAYVLLDPALPTWESTHTQHIWLEPQRVNLLVNPSFEGVFP